MSKRNSILAAFILAWIFGLLIAEILWPEAREFRANRYYLIPIVAACFAALYKFFRMLGDR